MAWRKERRKRKVREKKGGWERGKRAAGTKFQVFFLLFFLSIADIYKVSVHYFLI